MPKSFLRIIVAATLISLSFPLSSCTKAAKAARFMERAEEYFNAGDYDKAKIEYMNVLRADGKNVRAIARLGQIWFEQGSSLKAGPYLIRARELDPTNIDNRVRLARAFVTTGQVDQAKKEVIQILDAAPENSEALILLVDTVRTPEEIALAEERIDRFPQKDAPAYHLASAGIALRKGDRAAAEQAVQRAVAVGAKSVEAHNAMALLHLARKEPQLAQQSFKTAADLAPVRSNARTRYAEYLWSAGREKEAIAYATELTKQAPDFLSAWTLMVRIAAGGKRYDEALAMLENVFSRDPDNADGRLLQADAWLAKGETQKAVDQLERLNQIYPNVPIIKFQLARAHIQNKNLPQATEVLEQTLAAYPRYDDAIVLLAEINLRTGKPQAVVAPLEALRKNRPDLERARLLLADAYRALGRHEDAAALFREQLRDAPSAQPYYYTGVLLREQNKPAEARQAFEKAIELAPDNLAPVEQLVEMDISEKQFGPALQRVEQRMQKNPSSAAIYCLQAKVFLAQREWDRAEAALLKAVEIDSKMDAAYRLLIATYLAAGRLPDAVARLEKAVTQNPKAIPAFLTLGMAYDQMKEYAKARDTYERVLTVDPNIVVALNNLAFLYSEHFNEPNKAYELAGKARSVAPENPNIGDTLGWILFKRGDYQQAQRLLLESAAKLPDSPVIQFHSGMASYMMGDTEAARTAFQKAVNSPTDFAEKQDALRRLALLGAGTDGAKELSVAELERIIEAQPNDLVALVRLGEQLEKEGSFVKAAAAFRKAFELNPKLLQPVLKLAQLDAGPLKNREEALEFARKARELAPNDAAVTALLGRIAFDAGNFTWAFSLLQESVRGEGADAATLHRYAWAAYSLGKVQDAEAAMRRLPPNSDSQLAADAKTFLEMVQLDGKPIAVASVEPRVRQILAADPGYVPALMVRAAIEKERGEAAAATSTYNEVLQRYPDFSPAQKRLAGLYAAAPGQQEKAYTLATNARKALPDDPELATILARLSYGRGEHRRVIQLLQEAEQKKMQLDPLSLYFLGMSQLQVNQKPAARQSLEKALAAGLSDPEAAEAKKAIEKIGQP